jgi:hypothetical protein
LAPLCLIKILAMNDLTANPMEKSVAGSVHPKLPYFDAVPRFWSKWNLPKRSTRLVLESLLLALAIVCAGIWFSAPYGARDYINRKLGALPDYTGRVEWVRFHPLNASLDLYDLHLDKKEGNVPVPYFYSPRWHISLQWSQIIHGVFRSSVTILNPRINLVDGPDSSQTQLAISGVWIDAIKQLIPFRVNQIRIRNGDIHFLNFHADPKVDLEIQDLELDANNMSNSKGEKVPLPATIKVTARPLIQGYFEMNLSVNLDEKYATFSQSFKMEHVPAIGANSAVEKYAKVQVKSGEIGLYSELTGDKGVYHGYVKPFFYQLEFEPKPDDKGTPGALWSGIVNTVKGLFENDNKVIATEADISGRVDQPQIDTLSVIGGALWNAYIQALAIGFDTTHAPPQPTNTVTTPQSTATQAEAAQPSPADKK